MLRRLLQSGPVLWLAGAAAMVEKGAAGARDGAFAFGYQHEGLEACRERCRDDGPVLLGLPSGEFGEAYCAVGSPMSEKVGVAGDRAGRRWNIRKVPVSAEAAVFTGCIEACRAASS